MFKKHKKISEYGLQRGQPLPDLKYLLAILFDVNPYFTLPSIPKTNPSRGKFVAYESKGREDPH